MQQHARKPLRALRHDNYATFADLFTAALLQAAATGETLLESDQSEAARALQKLADKDASKVFRLNQRMQVQSGLLSPSACHVWYFVVEIPSKCKCLQPAHHSQHGAQIELSRFQSRRFVQMSQPVKHLCCLLCR